MNAISADCNPTQIESGHSHGLRIAILVALVGAIIVTHYLLSRENLFYHDLLRRSMYVPIVLSAFWFRTKGGVATALVAGFLYAPHLFLQHELSGDQELDRAAEMLLYVLIGGLTGLLVERHDFQRLETEGPCGGWRAPMGISLWVTAALGLAVGVGMELMAVATSILVFALLRFGPHPGRKSSPRDSE